MAALVALICLFGNLGAMGLVGPDEPRYAWIARAMAETGDWVTPRLYGQPWFEKPILYYWAAAAGFRLHLPAEWAARLPSALAALATALAIGWLAREHYDRYVVSLSSPHLLAPLIFSTSVAAIGFSRAATPDMLFSASITFAMASAAYAFRCAGALHAAGDQHDRSTESRSPANSFVRRFFGICRACKGPGGIILGGRRHRSLGVGDKAVARSFSRRTPTGQLPRSASLRCLGTYCARSAIQISYASSSFSIILSDISLPCFSTGSHFGFSFQSRFSRFFLGQFFYGPRFKKPCECGGKNRGCGRPDSFSVAGRCSR